MIPDERLDEAAEQVNRACEDGFDSVVPEGQRDTVLLEIESLRNLIEEASDDE